MKGKLSLILLAFVIASVSSQNLENFSDVVISKVTRNIDAASQLFRVDTRIEIKNERASELKSFFFAIPSEYIDSLRLFIVQDSNEKTYDYKILENLSIKNQYNTTLYKIEFDPPLKSGQTKSLRIAETYYGRMSPLPKQITTLEDQKVILEDSVYYFTPYTVLSQTTTYRLSAAPISFSDSEGRVRGQSLEYPISSTVQGFRRRNTRIHFENNTPFVVFKEVTKIIEVSHWGNINIRENYKLVNEGAQFKGEYSRVDYNHHNRHVGKNALRSLSADYPVHAWGMHYRDEVGNISTSRAWRDSTGVHIHLQPRFSLFGGWSQNWELSYNLPTNYYLFTKGSSSSYLLKQNFGFPFKNLLAEKYTVKVILPEGSTNLKVNLPFSIDSQHEEKTFSYLDIEGRSTLVLEATNILEEHNHEFTVEYDFDAKNMLTEPGLIFAFFLAVFFFAILVGRIDFSFKEAKAKKVKTN